MAEVTAHGSLLALLGEWVTVTHPDAPHRVWHGQLASLMDCPSIVLQMPEGGTEVLPQAFNVVGAAPTPGGPHPDVDTQARAFTELRGSGLLWLINRAALHPRGLALALHVNEHGQAYGWSLVTNAEGEPWQFDPATDNDGYRRAEATLAKALAEEPAERCPSCDHQLDHHAEDGRCWFTVDHGVSDSNLVCPCAPRPDDDPPPQGVRIEYWTRVPRSLAPAAIAEAFQAIDDARAAYTPAAGPGPDAARCCVCNSRPVVYENYRNQPFCGHCANCDCGQDVCVRTSPDDVRTPRPDASGPARAPILGKPATRADAVRTPDPDAASGRPDAPEWKVCGDRRCIDPRCHEEATIAEARERIANAMELPLDLIAPVRCSCGQTGPLIGEAADGGHFHISPEEHEQLVHGPVEGLPGSAWGKCWDRAEALRADLDKAVAAYEALRARVITTSSYVKQQKRAGFPLRGGDNRYRILDTLDVWTEDPGPLKLTTLTRSEAP